MPDAVASLPRMPAGPGPRARKARPKASDDMLKLFVGFQRTRCDAAGAAERAKALAQTCDRMLAALKDPDAAVKPSWADAYEVERDLLVLESGAPLLQSLKRLLDRADAAKVPEAADLRRSFEALLGADRPAAAPADAAVPPGDDLLLPLALTVLERVQWNRTERFNAVPLRHGAVHRLIASGLVSFALFALPYAWVAVASLSPRVVPLRDGSSLALWTALTAGLLGAFFSRLLTVQKGFGTLTLEEIETVGAWDSILLRGGVGMLGSLIVCFFLQSNLVAGQLFPKFSDILQQGAAGSMPTPALATLVVWSVIAGFSERLVPSVLARTEVQLKAVIPAGAAPPKPGS